ncbi:RNA polymerase sigma factor sigC [Platanthera zijinensis]|uniref:RNA polymerase sigma factor sigC n=1 Tax=Platanthera zijinensis TaxID=2320716 RepID=A0AAP0B6P4_9ASPA
MDVNRKLSAHGSDSDQLFTNPEYCRRLVGKLIYLTVTRPDISFALRVVSCFMYAARTSHLQAFELILRYLKTAPGQGLIYKPSTSLSLVAYSDADYAGSLDDRRSITGFCTYFGVHLITWRSKKQTVVARSSAEAEYQTMTAVVSELTCLESLLNDLGLKISSPTTLFCDSQATIHIAKNPVFHERTKHIEVDCHLIREKVQSKKIELEHVPDTEQVADILTKALSRSLYYQFISKLGSYDLYAPAYVHGLVKDSSDVENVKRYFDLQMTTGRCFPNGSRSVNNLDDVSIHCTSIITSPSSHFSLLNENVVKIENILADTGSVRLEKEILIHIRRLGALKLFHACLSKSRMPLAEASPNPQQTAHFRYSSNEYPVKQDITVVPSGKKEERKLRRSRAKEKNCITSPHSSNYKRISTPLATLQSKSRSVITRNESELSMAMKDAVSLERIRLKLEKETGEEVCHERWAEAAGIDLKTLHQRLHVGWHSRDKLIRSTRSLIFFLARNYKGIGVALDDLLQAGSIGVLKGAEKFDNSRGYRFSTYVRYWIRKSMLSLITRNSRGIQLPAVMVKIIKIVQDASKNFRMREGRFPEEDEIVDLTNISLDTIRLARRCSRAMSSLDHLEMNCRYNGHAQEATIEATIVTEAASISRKLKACLYLTIVGLIPSCRLVLLRRYAKKSIICITLRDLGKRYGREEEPLRVEEGGGITKAFCRDTLHITHFHISDIAYIPKLSMNVISVSQLAS